MGCLFSCPQTALQVPLTLVTDWLTDSLIDTTKEHSERLVTLDTCDEIVEETWPKNEKDKDKGNDNDKHKDKDNDKDI